MNTNTRNYTVVAATWKHDSGTRRLASKQPQYYRAPIDVHETEESFTIVADMPVPLMESRSPWRTTPSRSRARCRTDIQTSVVYSIRSMESIFIVVSDSDGIDVAYRSDLQERHLTVRLPGRQRFSQDHRGQGRVSCVTPNYRGRRGGAAGLSSDAPHGGVESRRHVEPFFMRRVFSSSTGNPNGPTG